MQEHRIDLDLPTSEALKVVSEAAERWGARWNQEGTGGRLDLPVTAGLRRGLLGCRLWFEPGHRGTRLVLRVESSEWSLNLPAVVVMLFGAAGAIAVTLWPFFPALLGIAPLAVVLALAAWLLVASRLRSSTAEDFLVAVELLASSPEPSSSPEGRSA